MTLSENEIFGMLVKSDVEWKGLLKKDHFDDCALVDIKDGLCLVISTDFVRGPWFDLAKQWYLSFYDLAHYLVAANVSDVACMWAIPKWFLDVFRYPHDVKKSDQEDFFEWLNDAMKHYWVELVWGDSGSYSEYVLSGTCFGFIDRSEALLRKNLEAGDLLCFAWSIWWARAAMVHFWENHSNKKIENKIDKELINYWKKPQVPVSLWPILSKNGWSKSAQDTSDGLSSTVYSMCRDSNVWAIIFEDQLPITDAVKLVAKHAWRNIIEMALGTSPDFGLLFSIKKKHKDIINNTIFTDKISIIWEITSWKDIMLEQTDGSQVQLPHEWWSQWEFKA